ncbi:peptidoglycan DD-metalloendopeptidase family protein [Bacillus sp. T33-2]|uniref:peptidoglycan DD-metalloendopeptidase family protein n=1 Tax=Bacillus sp. T33-2 TaxID=2054168 RepID=UPI000C775910|nr:peptidoglycan DD-metalloendopeptidase family protein [Bacillus sp. T33-2]PLR99785.1 hypothetical protein CVD19_01635 [Bacillus sp. T33-2]
MGDYIKRLLIAGLMALCVSLLFLGGKHSQAQTLGSHEQGPLWIWPSDGIITDTFGTRNGHHKGIDIAGDLGSKIYAVDKGTVTKSYYSGSYGHVIFIKHENNYETVYAHLHKRHVKEGQVVKKGETIGEMGNTGDSSGVHLHFEVHQHKWTFGKENALNPVQVLSPAEIGQYVYAHGKSADTPVTATARMQMPRSEDNVQEPRAVNHTNIIHTGQQQETVQVVPAEKQPEIAHTVQPGETLWSIAGKYGTSVEQIAEMNSIIDNNIAASQKINIKPGVANHYVVAAGDTLASIARKTNTSIEDIKKLNGLDSSTIHPQQILIVK